MTNTPTRQDSDDIIDALGKQRAEGEDTSVKFTLQMIQDGYHNIRDLTKNKHGTDRDDAAVAAERYFKARSANAIFDGKAGNQRKAASCARTGIKLGCWPKGGSGEPIATVNNFINRWQKLRKQPGMVTKIYDANNALLAFARSQLKRDTLIDESDFDEYIFKPSPDEASAEQIMRAAVKKLDGLLDGSASHGTVQHATPLVLQARNALNGELAAIAKAKAPVKVTP